MEIHVIGSKIPEAQAEKEQLNLIKTAEGKREEVHPSLRSIISQYDSEDDEEEQQMETEELPPDVETNTGSELLQNEGVNTEAKLKRDADDDDDKEDEEEEEDGEDIKSPAAPRSQDRVKRKRNNDPNPFEYGYNIPSPSTEVSGSESEDEYRPNIVKAKAGPNKRFKKKPKMEEKAVEDAAAKKTLESENRCQDCGKIFSHVYNLTRHRKRGVCRREPRCGICSDLFSDIATLKLHVQTHFESSSNKPFACCECNQQFSRRDGLKRHLVRSHPGKDVEELMERSTKAKDVQEKPRVNKPSNSSVKTLRHCRSKVKYQVSSSEESHEEACDENEEFQLPPALRTNALTSDKNKVLEQASKETDGKHLRLGRVEGKEGTNSMKKKPPVSQTLKRDKKRSRSVVPGNFMCEFCEKRFRDNYSLSVHRRCHTGERPFKCHICNGAFIRKWRLDDHLRRFHNITESATAQAGKAEKRKQKFKCIECDSAFTQASNLSRHMKSFHPCWEGWQIPSTVEAFQSTDTNKSIKQESSSPTQDQVDFTDILDYIRFSDDEESDRFISQSIGTLSFPSTSKPCGTSTFVKSANVSCFDDDDVMPLILPYLRKLKRNKKKLLANNMIRLEVDGAEEEDKKVVVEIDRGLLSCFLPTVPAIKSASAESVNETENEIAEEVNEDINKLGTMVSFEDVNENVSYGDPMEVNGSSDHAQFSNVKIDKKEDWKPFVCPYCEKQFKYNFQMKRHLPRHTGESAYECTICKRKFSQNQNLKNHMNLHTGELPYNCDKCDMRFSSTQRLYQHKKKRH